MIGEEKGRERRRRGGICSPEKRKEGERRSKFNLPGNKMERKEEEVKSQFIPPLREVFFSSSFDSPKNGKSKSLNLGLAASSIQEACRQKSTMGRQTHHPRDDEKRPQSFGRRRTGIGRRRRGCWVVDGGEWLHHQAKGRGDNFTRPTTTKYFTNTELFV